MLSIHQVARLQFRFSNFLINDGILRTSNSIFSIGIVSTTSRQLFKSEFWHREGHFLNESRSVSNGSIIVLLISILVSSKDRASHPGFSKRNTRAIMLSYFPQLLYNLFRPFIQESLLSISQRLFTPLVICLGFSPIFSLGISSSRAIRQSVASKSLT